MPRCGSEASLNVSAEKGALASDGRVSSLPVFGLVPRAGGTSSGEGR